MLTDQQLDRIIAFSEVDPDTHEYHPRVARPLVQARSRGVSGWIVVSPDEIYELVDGQNPTPMPITDLSVPVALQALNRHWFDMADLMTVLQARDQIMKPGDEQAYLDPDDQLYSGVCWCGYTTELFANKTVAENALQNHCEHSHS